MKFIAKFRDKIPYAIQLLIWLPLAALLGIIVSKLGLISVIGISFLFIAFFFIIIVSKKPVNGFFLAYLLAFFINGLMRYITGRSVGFVYRYYFSCIVINCFIFKSSSRSCKFK